MTRRPDMAAGTRNTALAINTSAESCRYETVETPLGTRHSILLVTVTGRQKEIALVRQRLYAGEIARRVNDAIHELNQAAELIARDREGV